MAIYLIRIDDHDLTKVMRKKGMTGWHVIDKGLEDIFHSANVYSADSQVMEIVPPVCEEGQ